MAKKPRRTSEEVDKLVKVAQRHLASGMSVDAAANRVGLYPSLLEKRLKKGGILGSVRADSLPPRPKKGHGGKRKPKPVDLTDMSSIAVRLGRIDRKLAGVDELREERKMLAEAMLKLLRGIAK